ncbi:hypothetical protein NAK66_002485 [Klebsiella oxytoca]|nr:hypothetical protein [Klebsiella oxytoca]
MTDNVIVKLTHPVDHDGETKNPPDEIIVSKQAALKIVRLECGIIISEIDDEHQDNDSGADGSGDNSDVVNDSGAGGPENNSEIDNDSGEPDDDSDNGSGYAGSLADIIPQIEPKDMTDEELEAELTAAGVELRDGASRTVLIARVKKLRKEANNDESVS